jgi:hypothetical protein
MKLICTRIGEHTIHIVVQTEKAVNWIRRNFPMEAYSGGEPDLFIQLKEGYGVPFVNYNVLISQYAHTVIFRRADYEIETDRDYRQSKVSVHDEWAFKHALMNLYSSFLVRYNWGLLIHSSCVVEKGGAHMFAGHSGAGKSTAAKLSLPRELLSDEATVVKITSDVCTVYNSPFRSELLEANKLPHCPLMSIQLLKQADYNQRIPLSSSNGLLQLMDKVFYWGRSPEETRCIMGLLHKLATNVPIYELHFQKNNTFWELISADEVHSQA